MKNIKIIDSIAKGADKTKKTLIKHSPEILIGAGLIGVVTSTVMACKATTKLSNILEEAQVEVELIHDSVGDESLPQEYTEEDSKKDLTIVYVQTGVKVIKLYAPAAIIGCLSILSILASHDIMKQRNLAMAAAYTTVKKGFDEYRKRVTKRFGEQTEYEIYHNLEKQIIEEVQVNEKTGKEKIVKKEVYVKGDSLAPYSVLFDETNPNWTKGAMYNQTFISQQQAYWNDRLRARGIVFLNEVYKSLGIDLTREGNIVGWTYDKWSDEQLGDGFIDFGIDKNENFKYGFEDSLLLEFNVDGEVLHTLPSRI